MNITDIDFNEIKFPIGWHLKKEFVDELGNEYALGKLTKLSDGTEVTPPIAVSQLKADAESRKPSKDDIIGQLLDRMDKMQAQMDSTPPDNLGISDLAGQIVKANREMDNKPVYETHIDPSDLLTVPVLFVSYGTEIGRAHV